MYIIKSSNSQPIIVRKAQNKQDALKKAENTLGNMLIDPKIKYIELKKYPIPDWDSMCSLPKTIKE